MPIPFEKLRYDDILLHKAAYDRFDRAGRNLFEDWDMISFEKAILGCGEPRFIRMAEEIKKTPNLYGDLNEKMPFLRFREKGQHYGYELFLIPPGPWCSRGAPLFWAYVAREFTFDLLPMNEEYLTSKYKTIVESLGLNLDGDRYVYFERFDGTGMSGGCVGEEFAQEGLHALQRRNQMYRETLYE